MPTPAESGFRHGRSTMPKLRVGMPPTIFAVMPQTAKVLSLVLFFFAFPSISIPHIIHVSTYMVQNMCI